MLSFILLCTTALVAQEPVDTALTLLRMDDPGRLLQRPVFTLPLSFAVVRPEQNRQLPLYQSFAGTPQSFAWERSAAPDLTAPLKLELYMSEPEKAVRITLGAASTAGALYMAYKHVKKYGFP